MEPFLRVSPACLLPDFQTKEGELSLPFLNLSRCFGRAKGASATDLPDFYRVTALCRFLTAATAKLEDRSSAFEVEKSRHSGEVWEGEWGGEIL